MEFPDPDGDVEARARTCRRQLRRHQTGRADAGVDHGPDGADQRSAAEGVFNVVNGFGVEAGNLWRRIRESRKSRSPAKRRPDD